MLYKNGKICDNIIIMNTYKKTFEITNGLVPGLRMHYCPGCTHGIVHRVIGEVLIEMDILGQTVGICPVGCAVFAYDYFNCDMIQASHGRAPAVATGVKRSRPDNFVFTYQGDGDLASIGMAEIVHAAARGEKFTTIFINNGVYGMTGGQMAPTTLVGQKATTCPMGRDVNAAGYPIKMAEMLATLNAPAFVTRQSVHNVKAINDTKKAIRHAFELQKENVGFSFIEVLTTCPTWWGMSPTESIEWLASNVKNEYPLGTFIDKG